MGSKFTQLNCQSAAASQQYEGICACVHSIHLRAMILLLIPHRWCLVTMATAQTFLNPSKPVRVGAEPVIL